MPLNTAAKNTMLDSLSVITHIGIHTLTDPGVGADANTGEATGGSPAYARKSVTWSAASGSQKASSASITWDVPAGTYGYFTLWNAATGNSNNYRGFIPFGGSSAVKGFFSVDTALNNDQFLSVAHGMANGDIVILEPVFTETLPGGTGLVAGAPLYVVGSGTNSFKLSTTSGGAAIDLTAINGGEGYFQRLVPEVFGAQGQITANAGVLILDSTAV